MAVREYIGARYIPIFATDAEWSSANTYEPLTVVTYEGCSYVSRQYVPAGIDLDNGDYWVLWADFNAQVEAYREEVQTFDGRIDALEDGLPVSDFDSENTVSDALDTIETAVANLADLLPSTDFTDVNTVKAAIDALSGDISDINALFPVSTANIGDEAITTAKIDDAAITWDKLANDVKTQAFDTSQKMIFIGDSYNVGTNSNTNGWGELVINELGLTDVVNCKCGGAGFDSATTTDNEFFGMNYPAVIEHLGTTMTEANRLLVKRIIFQGGWNDYNKSNVGTNMRTTRSKARTYFPNATLYCVLMLAGSRSNTMTRLNGVRQDYNNNAKRYGFAYAETFNLPFFFSTPSTDGIHPVESVMRYLAGFMGGVVVNGYQTDYETDAIIGSLRKVKGGSKSSVSASSVNGGTPVKIQDGVALEKQIATYYLCGIFTGTTPWTPVCIQWKANGDVEINQIPGATNQTGTCYWPDLTASILTHS